MNRIIQWLERTLLPIAGKIAEQRHLQAIRDGLIAVMPFVIIGSFFLILAFPPIAALDRWVTPYRPSLLIPVQAGIHMMALIATLAIGYRLAERYKLDALAGATISLVAFLLATPLQNEQLPVVYLGSKGLFVGIVLAVFSVEILRWFVRRNWVIRMPGSVPPAVARSFSALLPGLLIMIVVWGVRLLLDHTWGISIHQVVQRLLTGPLHYLGGTFSGALISALLMGVLWAIGIHGDAVVGSVMAPVFLSLTLQNQDAKLAGTAIPNTICNQFFDLFLNIGGTGTTLALTILLLFFARSRQLKSLGRVAIAPGLFNINEPIIFGLPIVMNPLLIIPFILVPIATTTLTYTAMELGWVPRPYALVPWTTPIGFGGWLTTGSWKGAVLQLINLTVACLIYYPFFRLWDRKKRAEEQNEGNQAADQA
jgi:PTS system cellobiose-specific IIC component